MITFDFVLSTILGLNENLLNNFIKNQSGHNAVSKMLKFSLKRFKDIKQSLPVEIKDRLSILFRILAPFEK